MSSPHPLVDSPLFGWGTPDLTTALVPLNSVSPRLVNAWQVKSGPGVLYGFTITNTKASAQFVQIFDSNTVPADGAVPILSKSVPATDAVGFSWASGPTLFGAGRTFLVGIVICNSSTSATKTIGSADCLIDAQFL